MRRKIPFISIIIIPFLFYITGCSKPPYDIKFEKEEIDIGTVSAGTNVDVVFKFKNKGSESIHIKLVRPTCGCTLPGDWDQTVKPGKTGRIPITYATEMFEGEVHKVIFADTNVPGRESIGLVITGTIYNPVQIQVKTAMLQITDKNKPAYASYYMKYHLDTPFVVDDIILPDNQVTANMVTIEPLKQYRLDITLYPPFEETDGFVTKKIILRVGGKVKNDYELQYSYKVPPLIQVNPKVVEVDLEKLIGEPYERRINVKSNIDDPIEIYDLHFDGTGVNYWIEALREHLYYQIPLIFPIGFKFPENKQTFYLSFKVKNDPKDRIYTITIKALEKEH